MTYDKNWTFQLNTEPTDQTTLQKQCQSWFIQLKTFLVTVAGWTVESSSDSVTYSPTTDLWGTDLNKIVSGVSSSVKSWILLKSPIGIIAGLDGSYLGDQSRVWLVIAAQPSGTNSLIYWRVTFHRENPTLVTPTTIVIPTSTNQIVLQDGATPFINRSPVQPYRWQFACTDKGNFYALATINGCNILNTAFIVYPVSEVAKIPNQDYPYAIAAQISSVDDKTHMMYFWTGKDSGSTHHLVFNGWHPDGAVTIIYKYTMLPAILSTTNSGNNPGELWNYMGYELSSGGDTMRNEWLSNVYISSELNQIFLMGKIADIKISGNINHWNTSTIGIPPTYCNFYNVWFPVNARFNS